MSGIVIRFRVSVTSFEFVQLPDLFVLFSTTKRCHESFVRQLESDLFLLDPAERSQTFTKVEINLQLILPTSLRCQCLHVIQRTQTSSLQRRYSNTSAVDQITSYGSRNRIVGRCVFAWFGSRMQCDERSCTVARNYVLIQDDGLGLQGQPVPGWNNYRCYNHN